MRVHRNTGSSFTPQQQWLRRTAHNNASTLCVRLHCVELCCSWRLHFYLAQLKLQTFQPSSEHVAVQLTAGRVHIFWLPVLDHLQPNLHVSRQLHHSTNHQSTTAQSVTGIIQGHITTCVAKTGTQYMSICRSQHSQSNMTTMFCHRPMHSDGVAMETWLMI